MADLTVAVAESHALAPHQTGASRKDVRTLGGPGSGNFGHAGRPGEVGGSSDTGGNSPDAADAAQGRVEKGTPDFEAVFRGVSPEVAKVLTEESQKLYDLSFGDDKNVHETLSFVDIKNGKVILDQPLHGTVDSVHVPEYVSAAIDLYGPRRDVVAVHTHPSGSSLSFPDFNNIVYNRYAGGMVIGKNGVVHEVRMNSRPNDDEISNLRYQLNDALWDARQKAVGDTDDYIIDTYQLIPSVGRRDWIIEKHPEIETKHTEFFLKRNIEAWEAFAKQNSRFISYRMTPAKAGKPVATVIEQVKAAASKDKIAYIIDDTSTTSIYAKNGAPARAPLRTAARQAETLIHRAADKHAPKLSVTFRYAFALGRRALRPGKRNVEKCIEAITAALEDILPKQLRKVYLDGAEAGVAILKAQGLRTAYSADQPRDESGKWTDGGALSPTDNDPPEGYVRLYRGVNPTRNEIASDDDTHGYWYSHSYNVAVGYANWDYEGTGELGPGRAILAVDVPRESAIEFAKSGSRSRPLGDDWDAALDDEDSGLEMIVDIDAAKAARIVEGDEEEGKRGRARGLRAAYDADQPRDESGKWIDGGFPSDDTPRHFTELPADAEKRYESWASSLTKEEIDAFDSYTSESEWGPSGNHIINEALRGMYDNSPPFAAQKREAEKNAAILTAAINKSTVAPPPLVYRGVGAGVPELPVGTEVRLKGFQSTSLVPETARAFGDVLFEIRPSRGVYLEGLTKKFASVIHARGEAEFLLPHNAEYRVHGVKELSIGGRPTRVIQLVMR